MGVRMPGITKVVFNPPATVVMWDDGTKTVVKAMEGDEFSEELGLAMAVARRYFGSRSQLKKTVKERGPAFSYELRSLGKIMGYSHDGYTVDELHSGVDCSMTTRVETPWARPSAYDVINSIVKSNVQERPVRTSTFI